MQNKPELLESLKTVAEKLPEDDLKETQLYAEYLISKRPYVAEHVGIHEFLEQHEEHGRLMISLILQRSRLISMVNRLAQIILEAKNVSDIERRKPKKSSGGPIGFHDTHARYVHSRLCIKDLESDEYPC
jgi:hypothetical protein